MEDRFRLIAITPERTVPDEPKLVEMLIDSGFDFVHVRKPDADEPGLRAYLKSIGEPYRAQLTLHDRHELAEEYGIGGIHLNRRNPEPPIGFPGRVSRSLHSIDELNDSIVGNDYCTLSPIYDSISKAGYRSHFSADALRNALTGKRLSVPVIALGGVTPDRIGELQQLGFAGAAFLGYLFADANAEVLSQRIKTIKQHL
ncbi:MAG: thiamine phosphate synthase [Candidatus Limisoma sp.]